MTRAKNKTLTKIDFNCELNFRFAYCSCLGLFSGLHEWIFCYKFPLCVIYYVSWSTVLSDLKAPFSIATTRRCS